MVLAARPPLRAGLSLPVKDYRPHRCKVSTIWPLRKARAVLSIRPWPRTALTLLAYALCAGLMSAARLITMNMMRSSKPWPARSGHKIFRMPFILVTARNRWRFALPISAPADIRIPWLDIRKGDKHKFHQLADEITGLTRRETGSTSHISALGFSMDCLDNCPWEATRTVVDVMTDGKNNTGGSNTTVKSYVKNLAEDYEATVNALVTVTSSERDLDEWARKTLVTPGGFIKQDGRALDRGSVKVVARQDNGNTLNKVHDAMRIAFREKLILEVADLELDNLREQVTKERRAGPLGLIQRLL